VNLNNFSFNFEQIFEHTNQPSPVQMDQTPKPTTFEKDMNGILAVEPV